MKGLCTIIGREFRAIATSSAILLVLMGGIFFYGLLYNYMYAPNLVTKVPMAVVDEAQTVMSRRFVRWMDATPQIEIYREGQQTWLATDFHQARQWMKERKVEGIFYLPADFEEKVLRGEQSVFVMYGTTSAFLYFEALQEAGSRVMLGLNEQYRPATAVFLPPGGLLSVLYRQPIAVSGTPLYNYTKGYGSYLIPAVLMVILFQTLMMVVGMRSGMENEQGMLRKYAAVSRSGGWVSCILWGKAWVYIALYAIFSLFLLGLLPLVFTIPHIGRGMDVVGLLIPFLLATVFLGLGLFLSFTDSEAPLLFIAFFSVGLIFLSGVSYPLERMPWYWRWAHYLLPAPPATLAFVQIHSMGASLADVRTEYLTLWGQTVVFFGFAWMRWRKKLQKI